VGVAVSLVIAAVGLILALAVHPASPGSVDPNTVGWILFVVGLVGLILDLVLWSSWGPGYMRRGSYVGDHADPARRRVGRPVRRTVVEEEDVVPGPPPPGY
jgi:hypothetical protein